MPVKAVAVLAAVVVAAGTAGCGSGSTERSAGSAPSSAAGAKLDFGDGTFCHLGTGRYSWAVANGRLTLHALAPDPCTGRSMTFDGGAFRR